MFFGDTNIIIEAYEVLLHKGTMKIQLDYGIFKKNFKYRGDY